MKTATRPDLKHREFVKAQIEAVGIIPAIRVSSAEDAFFAAEAVASAGIPIVEVTMTVPGATKVIFELVQRHPGMVIGAGTVLEIETAQRCLDVGASFLTTTGLDLEILQFARKKGVVVFPGALSPTEIATAWRAGADFVKIFPTAQMGGASYIRALRAPFPELRFIAAGGVNQNTAAEFIEAGATALGIGEHLVQPEAIRTRERNWILELARRYVRIVQQARNP